MNGDDFEIKLAYDQQRVFRDRLPKIRRKINEIIQAESCDAEITLKNLEISINTGEVTQDIEMSAYFNDLIITSVAVNHLG